MNSNNALHIKHFFPLIAVFTLIITITIAHQIFFGWSLNEAMIIFMAAFFIIFGSFKIMHLAAFAQAFSMYDIMAQKIPLYGYLYPFIELGLGSSYLFLRSYLLIINCLTFLLMFMGSISVALELQKKRAVECACLGTVFKIPMTYVTLLENILMGGMALLMLFW